MINFELISNLSGVLLFSILLVLLVINWRGQLIGGILIACALTSILFFSAVSYNSVSGDIPLALLRNLLLLRDISWLVFLINIIRIQSGTGFSPLHKYIFPGIITGISLFIFLGLSSSYYSNPLPVIGNIGIEPIYYGYLFLSLIGLVLVEQVYRSTKKNLRWTIKFLCLGIGGIFAFDFFLYSDAILFSRVYSDFWYARGAVNAVCVPFIVVSIKRVPEWKIDLFISRHVIFQSTIFMLAGMYLILMATAGYYVRIFGGSYGGALETIFLFMAVIALIAVLFSTNLRARLRIFLAKHFYENKYDYRDEWLGFTRMLAESQREENIYRNIIRAFADTMKCRGGAIWLASKDGRHYLGTGDLHLKEVLVHTIPSESELIHFLSEKHWIINLDDYKANAQHYDRMVLPEFIQRIPNAALLIPLLNEEYLLGIMLLTQSDINMSYNWEDYDLLKTMGRQSASFIAMLRATEDLTEAKQFEAFNRLSAYVVHDMKNIAAQLTLVSSNSKKHRDNRKFLDDAFETIDNAVAKMNRLTRSLKKDALKTIPVREPVDMRAMIEDVVKAREVDNPPPVIKQAEYNLTVLAGRDRLMSVVEHLVQNAQEATQEHGNVEIYLGRNDHHVVLKIMDTGCGMDEEFIRTRLFKPFDTTKGNAGMGIGVYESREVIEELGGKIGVDSLPGKGTTFTIMLPLYVHSGISVQDTIPGEAL